MARWLNLALQPTKTGESVFFDSESGFEGYWGYTVGSVQSWFFGLERKEVSEGQCVFRSEI